MKTANLVCYTLGSKPTAAERNRFRKQFLGYTDFSNKGKYRYARKGLLSEIPHIKIIRSIIIVRKEDCKQVVEFLKTYNATIFVKTVILTAEDQGYLELLIKIHLLWQKS